MPPSFESARSRRVLVRVDWNVPLGPAGDILDPYRMTVAWPTIAAVREASARAVLILTHLGSPVVRPRETVARTLAGNPRLRLAPIARYLLDQFQLSGNTELLELPNCPLPAYQLAPDLILLENLRFHPGELANDDRFARMLARLGDIVVNEAFSESHRRVASLVALPALLPTIPGLRLTEEVAVLGRFRDKPEKPFVVALGGAKVHDKIALIDNVLKKVDAFLLGGVMANTFLAAQGTDMRRSLVETNRLDAAKELFNRAPQKFILPLDFTWERDRALDIGPQTVALFSKYLAKARSIFWNGPMGWTDSGRDLFTRGSVTLARSIGASSGTSVAAGGDTLAVIDRAGLRRDFTFPSTGGGAALAYLSGADMPGLAGLKSGSEL